MEDSKLREINEIVSSPENMAKNSVSLLMEAASQVGETVSFNYVDELGLSNTRLFECEVKVGRLTKCRGSGINKKMAKANAADQALELIRGRTSGSTKLPVKSKVRTLQFRSKCPIFSQIKGKHSLSTSQVANQAGVYLVPTFCSMNRLAGVFPPSLPLRDRMLVHYRVTPQCSVKSVGLWERCIAQECNITSPDPE